MSERQLPIKETEDMLRHRARHAEVARWQYVNLRDSDSGLPILFPNFAARTVGSAELRLDECCSVVMQLGLLGIERVDSIVSRARRNMRAKLDAKWLSETEESAT